MHSADDHTNEVHSRSADSQSGMDHGRDENDANVLIDRLPALISRTDAFTVLNNPVPARSNDFRTAPLEHRTEALASLSELFIAMPHHATTMVKLLQIVRTGYRWRNPNNPAVWRHITLLSDYQRSPRVLPPANPVGGGGMGLTLTGMTGSGKTSMLNRFESYLRDERAPDEPIIHTNLRGLPGRIVQIPCVRIQCPRQASVKALANAVIAKLDIILGTNYLFATKPMREWDVLNYMYSLCSTYFVGILIIDDTQFLRGMRSNAEPVLNEFCRFMEVTAIPLLITGTLRLKHLTAVYPGAGSKLAAHGDITLHALDANSNSWATLVDSLWRCSVLRAPIPMPPDFPQLLHRHTLGIQRVTRELFQILHGRLAELEEDGGLARFLEQDGAFVKLLDEISANELSRYEVALNLIRKAGGKSLPSDEAALFEDYFLPREEEAARVAGKIARNAARLEAKKPPVEQPSEGQPSGGPTDSKPKKARKTPTTPSSKSTSSKKTKTAAQLEKLRAAEEAKVIAESDDPYKVVKDLGWLAPPLHSL